MTIYDASAADLPAAGLGGRPATGEQYLLRRGSAIARIGQVAAVLREFSVAGTCYTETWQQDATPPLACGIVLMPWPNRVAGGQWRWEGAQRQLDISEPDRGNAIHGLLRYAPYLAESVSEDALTVRAAIYPQHGWPFTLDTAVTYALVDLAGGGVGLRVTHEVRNEGAGPAVFGCGAHPYLRIGDVPTDDLTLTIRAGSVFITDDRLIPIEKRPLTGDLAKLPGGARVAQLHLDTGFTDLEPGAGGRFEHVLTAPDGRTLTLWAEADFRYTVVFTPDVFPDVDGGGVHRAVAVEPMTCPTDALNSGEGLITLGPGESWSASWGLSPGE